MWRLFIVYCSLIVTVIQPWSATGWKIKQRTSYVGQRLRLLCRTTVSYYVDWRRLATLKSDHAYIYSNGHVYPAFQSRFSVETTDSGDEYTLVIADVQLNDSAFYLCIEDAGLGNRHLFQLNVTDEIDVVSDSSADVSPAITVVDIIFVVVVAAVEVLVIVMLHRRDGQTRPTGSRRSADLKTSTPNDLVAVDGQQQLLRADNAEASPDDSVAVRSKGTSPILERTAPENDDARSIVATESEHCATPANIQISAYSRQPSASAADHHRFAHRFSVSSLSTVEIGDF